MSLQLRELQKKDFRQIIDFAVTGMHFDWYMKQRFFQRLYGRYFWYMELNRATQVIAAYDRDVLAGVLLARISGEPAVCRSPKRAAYVNFFNLLQKLFADGSAGVYDRVNREMFREYARDYRPDGEIVFLAANPALFSRGTGTLLLRELARREPGKELYLYTDNACSYPFYERRGFARAGERPVVLSIGSRKVDLHCFLYRRVMDESL
ncbi:MAG: GNAT family N-acetyltransferase [Eubacteriales bacterium]|nr:GNAT family N-acetyltransferase [Eubacteriales bacterium]